MNRQLVNTEEASKMLGLSVSTLKLWRYIGVGPPFVKLGRAVRYDLESLKDWLEDNTVKGSSADSVFRGTRK